MQQRERERYEGRADKFPVPELNTEWYPAKTASGTLVPWSCVEVKSGGSGNPYTVGAPTSNDQANVGVLNEFSADTDGGCVSFAFPKWVRYSGTTPAKGDDIGAVAGQTYMSVAQKGFVVIDVDTTNQRCLINFKRVAGGDPFLEDGDCLKIDWTSECYGGGNSQSGTIYITPMYDYQADSWIASGTLYDSGIGSYPVSFYTNEALSVWGLTVDGSVYGNGNLEGGCTDVGCSGSSRMITVTAPVKVTSYNCGTVPDVSGDWSTCE